MRCGAGSDSYCCSKDDCCNKEAFVQFNMANPTVTATAGIAAVASASSTSTRETASESPSSSSSSGPDSKRQHTKETNVIVGAAVGIGGGVPLLGCLVVLVFFFLRGGVRGRLLGRKAGLVLVLVLSMLSNR